MKAQMQKRLLVYGFFHSQPRFAVAPLFRELQPFDFYLVVACRRDKDVFDIFVRLGRLGADCLFLGERQQPCALDMRKKIQLHAQQQ